jgi:chromosome segregation ATPase
MKNDSTSKLFIEMESLATQMESEADRHEIISRKLKQEGATRDVATRAISEQRYAALRIRKVLNDNKSYEPKSLNDVNREIEKLKDRLRDWEETCSDTDEELKCAKIRIKELERDIKIDLNKVRFLFGKRRAIEAIRLLQVFEDPNESDSYISHICGVQQWTAIKSENL